MGPSVVHNFCLLHFIFSGVYLALMFSMCYIISAPGIFDIVGYLFMLPERFVSGILVTRKENYTTLWGHQAILEQNNQIPP